MHETNIFSLWQLYSAKFYILARNIYIRIMYRRICMFLYLYLYIYSFMCVFEVL